MYFGAIISVGLSVISPKKCNFEVVMMKNHIFMKRYMRLLTAILAAGIILTASGRDNRLVILHTNDFHSQIDPADNGLGGVARRGAAIDSIRGLYENVLLIDAGDAVQGTMYFTIYKGEVEYGLLDRLGYDICVLGNHDFDNGVKSLEKNLVKSNAEWLSANYDFADSLALCSIFKPYTVKEYGGKKVGVIGINLRPEGMIAEGNYDGVTYADGYERANVYAKELKEKGADYVIAVTHIGYDGSIDPSDVKLAKKSENIDLIIGGHSHSVVSPDAQESERYHWRHVNAVGDTIGIVQTGSRGAYLGKVELDLDNGEMDYELITIDSVFDNRLNPSLLSFIDGYRNAVDSVMHIPAGKTARSLTKSDAGLMNFLGDFVAFRGEQLYGVPVDISLMNSGGVRRDLPEGAITKGMLIDMLPFNNRIVVLEISGADLLEAVNGVVRRGGFDGTNSKVKIVFDPETKRYVSAQIDGKDIETGKTYVMATIDYLANGGDYMTSLPRAEKKAVSDNVIYDDLIEYVEAQWKGIPIDGDPARRIMPAKQ